jgi:hypothetical protein
MSLVGHSRLSRASRNSGHVRYAAESGSKFSRYTAARRGRYAAPVARNELVKDRAAFREPLSVPTSSGAHEPAVERSSGWGFEFDEPIALSDGARADHPA